MSEKKGATRQSFIRKEITTYRIGTLEGREEILVIFGWHFGRNDDLINSF